MVYLADAAAKAAPTTADEVLLFDAANMVVGPDGETRPAIKRVASTALLHAIRGHYSALDPAYGIDNTGVADCAAGFALLDAAAGDAGVRVIPEGTYLIASTVTFQGPVLADPGAVFRYSGSGTALTVRKGTGATRMDWLVFVLPRVIKITEAWGADIGVALVNIEACKAHVPHVQNFGTGLLVTAFGAIGSAYNHIDIGHLDNNKVNLRLQPGDASAWVNENTFTGAGRLSHNSSEGSNVAGVRHIQIETGANLPNNNLFLRLSLEGDVPEYHVQCYGSYNHWAYCRWEATTPKVHWAASSADANVILYGYNAHNIVVTTTEGAADNHLYHVKQQRIQGSLAAGVYIGENGASSANPVFVTMPAGDGPNADPATRYGWRAGQNTSEVKGLADTGPRWQATHSTGRQRWGPGDGTFDHTLQRVGTAGMQFTTPVGVGSVAALPTASSTYRGFLARVEGGTGVPDGIYACLKRADGTYGWAALGDGRTDVTALGVVANDATAAAANSTAIDAAILQGKELYFPPNSDGSSAIYYIGSTITLAQPGAAISSNTYGGWSSTVEVMLRAATGFVGPLIKFQPISGDGGATVVRNINLDGDFVAGVTALIENGDNCLGACQIIDVAGRKAPIGILTGRNQENIHWTRVEMWLGIGIGVQYGPNNRHIVANRCIFGGYNHGMIVGLDNNITGDRCENIVLDNCTVVLRHDDYAHGGATPTSVVTVYNVWNFRSNQTLWEVDAGIVGTIGSMVVLGSAASKPIKPRFEDLQFLGNNKASHGIEFNNVLWPVVEDATAMTTLLTSDLILNTMLFSATMGHPNGSGGVVWGNTVDDATGLAIAYGGTGSINTWKTGFKVEAAAGTVGFGVLVTGDTVPRAQLDTVSGLALGSGSASPDVTLSRTANADMLCSKRLRGTTGLITNTGTTAARHATPIAGQMYYDTTLGKPVWYDGANWVDATGATV